ncbi:MAG: hypothetical protein R6U98_01195 [Pirellulaceae bacterium]
MNRTVGSIVAEQTTSVFDPAHRSANQWCNKMGAPGGGSDRNAGSRREEPGLGEKPQGDLGVLVGVYRSVSEAG